MTKELTRTALLFDTYNGLFLGLPFKDIEDVGSYLTLFGRRCKLGLQAQQSPKEIIDKFLADAAQEMPHLTPIALLRYFVRYTERQVVLFDSVEDALFEHTHDMNSPMLLKSLLNRTLADDIQPKLLEKLRSYSIRLVLTAHPTQFYPGKVLAIINDLGLAIKDNDIEDIRLLLMQLGKTAFFNREKPKPEDEAASLIWFLENVFYDTIPDVIFQLLTELKQDVTSFENPRMLALGFWPGGDRDGNPNVKAQTTQEVARRLRDAVLRCYHREIRLLRRRLTFRGTEDYILKAERWINNTLYYPTQDHYDNCQELIEDLLMARKYLIEDHDSLFLSDLDRFILRVRVFGFHFASLDIRQDSRKHAEVWQPILQNWHEQFPFFDLDGFTNADEETKVNMLLSTTYRIDENDYSDPFVKDTLSTFRAVTHIQKQSGEQGCHRYIISNCGSALDVASVLAFAQMTMPYVENHGVKSISLDIVPLFETIDDLAECGKVMEQLYSNTYYARHLSSRGNVQTIMLGFSDGTKDGGYLRSNWSIYRAKAELTRISRAHGVSVIFFDGRGGPPGRGGGNNTSYYAAQGAEIEDRAIQVTIQGQTVSSTYGTRQAARYNIERLFTAGLENPLFGTHSKELDEAGQNLLDDLSNAAYDAYLKLKNHPCFVPYLEKMTPLRWYGDTNIASRPTKRSGGEGLKFEDLRAIPFVGAWAQMKQNIPGFYGLGSALATLKKRNGAVLRLYQDSLFFRTLVENAMQALAKSNFDVTRYVTKDKEFGEFWNMLNEEFERTQVQLKNISGQKELLENNPRSRQSINLREDIVLPLIVIQQYALQKTREMDPGTEEYEQYRQLVLRAMFGIINAARNAA
jgi:phosphoenolpyruvate carboxylase